MPTNDRRRGRTGVVLRCLGGAAMAVAAVAMLAPAPAHAGATAHAGAGPDGFKAVPPPATAFVEIDLFRVFTDCLAEAAHGDSMYPGIDPAEVNRCLADYGL